MEKVQKASVTYRHRIKFIGDYTKKHAAELDAEEWLKENGIKFIITDDGRPYNTFRFRKKVEMLYFLLVKGGKDWGFE